MMTKLVNKSFPFVYKNTHTDLVLHIYDLTELKTSYHRKKWRKMQMWLWTEGNIEASRKERTVPSDYEYFRFLNYILF